jgi:ankyrin repeat protein
MVHAIQQNKLDQVRHMVEVEKHDPSRVKDDVCTLLLCIHENRFEIFDMLLGFGANPNARNVMGKSLLHTAAKHGETTLPFLRRLLAHPDIVVDPIKIGCEWGVVDALMTPLYQAILSDNVEGARALLEAGASTLWMHDPKAWLPHTWPNIKSQAMLAMLTTKMTPAELDSCCNRHEVDTAVLPCVKFAHAQIDHSSSV